MYWDNKELNIYNCQMPLIIPMNFTMLLRLVPWISILELSTKGNFLTILVRTPQTNSCTWFWHTSLSKVNKRTESQTVNLSWIRTWLNKLVNRSLKSIKNLMENHLRTTWNNSSVELGSTLMSIKKDNLTPQTCPLSWSSFYQTNLST